MSLYQLPPEILPYAFRLLSPAFFRQDARRLLVFRQWYQLARPVLLQDLDFSAESLRNFVLASNKVGMIRSVRNHVKALSLALDDFENWHSAQFEPSSAELSGIDLQTMNTWASELNDFLVALAGILKQCTRLQSLKLEARPEGHGPLISLEDFVINLSLSEMSSSDTSYRYPIRCEHIPGDSFPRLKADVESHATKVVRMMKNPRMARIVSHTFPGLKIHSFDAITGRRMLLSSAAPWDADGDELKTEL
ncbi:hypothetical protein E5D57_000097 [Metarhizium anisopliae]|nr:hypothetical protein E5D57_000097 [Metarhizium anisopliae]